MIIVFVLLYLFIIGNFIRVFGFLGSGLRLSSVSKNDFFLYYEYTFDLIFFCMFVFVKFEIGMKVIFVLIL